MALDHAARLFNERGIAATSIADVAAAMQVTRAALYYYFDERDDLVFQTYERACQIIAGDLEAADEEGGDGLAKTLSFTRRALAPGKAPIAVLGETDYLKAPQQSIIARASARNTKALEGFVEQGIADGSVRPCDAHVMAHTIAGFVSWIQLTPAWLDIEETEAHARDANAVLSLLRNGVGAPHVQTPAVSFDVEALRPSPGNPFDRDAAANAKIETLLATASRLFNRRGVEGVSLDDVTAELGATKGALYHYFSDKADLVHRCYDRAFGLYEAIADHAMKHGRTGLEQTSIGVHLNTQAQAGALSPLAPLAGVRGLSKGQQTSLLSRAEAISRRYEAMGRRGLKDGTLQMSDVPAQARAGAGLFAWISKWRRADDPRSPQMLGDEIVRLYTRGLSAA
ncbi:MAG: TetR/AcrR family transcriptional regulator [Hyphomonadaceae bacterium]|nr:TetR/AcrR family transcriptional regulator [Hyphomonadaceae bacterium]